MGSQASIDRSSWKARHEDNWRRVNSAGGQQPPGLGQLTSRDWPVLSIAIEDVPPSPPPSLRSPETLWSGKVGPGSESGLWVPRTGSFTLLFPPGASGASGSFVNSFHHHWTLSQAWQHCALYRGSIFLPQPLTLELPPAWLWRSGWYLRCCGLSPNGWRSDSPKGPVMCGSWSLPHRFCSEKDMGGSRTQRPFRADSQVLKGLLHEQPVSGLLGAQASQGPAARKPSGALDAGSFGVHV